MSHIFLSQRSSPGEARESHAVEGERLGKRVRKKRKIYMDSGDEEEENQEEPEVRRLFFASLSCIHPQSHRTLKCSLLPCSNNLGLVTEYLVLEFFCFCSISVCIF